MGLNNLVVKCYSGHIYAERPAFFWLDEKEYEVKEVENEWLEPDGRYFLVRTVDNKLYQLCYNETDDYWSLKELAGD